MVFPSYYYTNRVYPVIIKFQPCVIDDCGELQPGEDDGTTVDDGTGDILPESPEDSELDTKKVGTPFCITRKNFYQ